MFKRTSQTVSVGVLIKFKVYGDCTLSGSEDSSMRFCMNELCGIR